MTPEQWALELEDQVASFAKRVAFLWRRHKALILLLRSIKSNGGCSDDHWYAIDTILHIEGSGRAIRVNQITPPARRSTGPSQR